MNLPIPASKMRIATHGETRHNTRVLVVDDDDFFRGREQEVLNRAGYLTMGAADGQEALALLSMGAFDLVLTDWQMPRLDGIGFIRALRAAGIRIPVVMIFGPVAAGSELPEDVRREIAVTLPKRRGREPNPGRYGSRFAGVLPSVSGRCIAPKCRMPLRFERRVDPIS
jgi:CheY-like chemotaxis protein